MRQKTYKNYSTTENEIRFIRYHKKGILRLIFSRLAVIVIMLLIQMEIIISIFERLEEKFPYYTAVIAVFTIVMVIYLFNCSMDSSAKLTWLMIISIAPVPGAIFLAFTKFEFGHGALKKRVIQTLKDTTGIISSDEGEMEELRKENRKLYEMNIYLNKTGTFPIYKNTGVTYFPSGEDKYEKLIEDIKGAERYIFLEYFIIDEGYMWGRMLKILSDKVKEGVEVRILYDGMCEMQLLPHNYEVKLESLGIKAAAFSPIYPFVSTYYNYRDHRKIAVIDGKIAYNGGVNLADEYINKIERFGYWKDTAVRLEGEAVQSFTLMFLQMWAVGKKENVDESFLKTIDKSSYPENDGYVMPYGDVPVDNEKVGENVYIDILNRANDYVHIMTPYLILDDELKNIIKYTSERGVDVSIILPGIPDKVAAYSLAKSHYRELLEAGVSIYEYTPGFVHAKVFVSDDKSAVVGSINLDYRSLYHHFECATYMYKCSCISDIENDFQATLEKCRKVTVESIKRDKIVYKVLGPIVKMVAPLM